MTTMQAAVVHAFGKDLTIDDVPVPTPGPGQALVKLITSGVCHTDLHAVEGDWPAVSYTHLTLPTNREV